MMNFIKCPCCNTPLSLNGDEKLVTCSICGSRINADIAKYIFAISSKPEPHHHCQQNWLPGLS